MALTQYEQALRVLHGYSEEGITKVVASSTFEALHAAGMGDAYSKEWVFHTFHSSALQRFAAELAAKHEQCSMNIFHAALRDMKV